MPLPRYQLKVFNKEGKELVYEYPSLLWARQQWEILQKDIPLLLKTFGKCRIFKMIKEVKDV